jgi:hypothetical protein
MHSDEGTAARYGYDMTLFYDSEMHGESALATTGKSELGV